MASTVKKAKVTFNVVANPEYKNVYVLGDAAELGNWDPKGSLKLTYNEETNCYEGSKMLPVDQVVSYKVCATNDWNNVECGSYGEEVENHTFTVAKGHKEVVTCANFKNV